MKTNHPLKAKLSSQEISHEHPFKRKSSISLPVMPVCPVHHREAGGNPRWAQVTWKKPEYLRKLWHEENLPTPRRRDQAQPGFRPRCTAAPSSSSSFSSQWYEWKQRSGFRYVFKSMSTLMCQDLCEFSPHCIYKWTTTGVTVIVIEHFSHQ